MDASFKSSDDVLEQLVATRRDEVVRLQQAQADGLKDLESRGQARLAELRKSLPKDIVDVLDRLDKGHADAAKATDRRLDRVKAEFVESAPRPENETAFHPGLAGGQLVAPSSLGWFSPYYGTLHWSDGTVVWQGYYPGTIDLWISCNGSGSGIFGTGACEGTLVMDWWFTYLAPANRYYGHTIWVPYHGFYIISADDGFWDSKYASARIDLAAVGYQYNLQGHQQHQRVRHGGRQHQRQRPHRRLADDVLPGPAGRRPRLPSRVIVLPRVRAWRRFGRHAQLQRRKRELHGHALGVHRLDHPGAAPSAGQPGFDGSGGSSSGGRAAAFQAHASPCRVRQG